MHYGPLRSVSVLRERLLLCKHISVLIVARLYRRSSVAVNTDWSMYKYK